MSEMVDKRSVLVRTFTFGIDYLCKVGLLEDNADASACLQGLYRYFGERS